MTQHFLRKSFVAAALVAAFGAAPQLASAAVTVTGCSGGTFGDACGLNELVAGGSMAIGGYTFSNFALSLAQGRLLNSSAIRVDAIDIAGSAGFSFVDVAGTLRAVNGDLTSNNLSFDITPLAGSPQLLGGSLRVAVGDITGSGSYATAFADLFNPSLTSFYGNMTAYCDGPTCTNSTVSSPLSLTGPQSALSVVAGIDVAAAAGGLAQINSVSMVLTPVPEPEVLPLLGLGIAALAWRQRKLRASES